METKLSIRTASPLDVAAIANLSAELGYDTTSEEVSDRIRFLIQSPDHEIFVAVGDSNDVVGWVHVYTNYRLMVDPFAEIGGLIVKEDQRGNGIGNQLLRAAEEWAKKRGLDEVRVRSNVTRERAHKFYISNDYETVKSQKVFQKTLQRTTR